MNTQISQPTQALSKPDLHVQEDEFDRNFKPNGAIAFFILLIILGLAIWYGIYFLMLSRV